LVEKAALAVTVIEAEFAAAAGALAAASAERTARERTAREAHAKLRRLEDERNAVLHERDRLEAEFGGTVAADTAVAALAQSEAELGEREGEVQAAEAALANARETEARARAPYEHAERNLGALQAEARTLAELLDLENTKGFSPVIDALRVAPGYEKALVAALGDDLGASLDPGAPASWGPCGPGDGDAPLPAGAEPLSEQVAGPEELQRRLRQIGVVTAESAPAFLPRLAAGQRLVTREGALWRWDGFRAEQGSAASGARRLEQRNRVAVLVHELKSARALVDKTAELFGAARQVRADAERLEADSRAAVRQAREAVDARRKALAEAERRANRTKERLSAFAGALARIEADTDATRAELRIAANSLAGLADVAELQARRDELQSRLTQSRSRAAETRLQAEKALHEDSLRSRRTADLAADRDRWRARVARAAERTRELCDRLQRLETELAGLSEGPEDFAARRRAVVSEIAAAEKAAAAAADGLAAAEGQHREAARTARDALQALGRVRETCVRGEERAIAARIRRDELISQVRERFGVAVDELRTFAGITGQAPVPAAGVIESRLGKLKNERDRLGGVNLRAEEEANETGARLDAMRKEREDLEEAIKRLRQGIGTLNKDGRERLLAAFEAVNGHFRSLFQHLFGGGTAELTLTGSDDPLEAGLDIVARPPGKRPHTMTLLSGGEQALTALSLIFAVFLTNPSPICVLDEVDAPLDDANVERFCALLDDMRNRVETRFVVVTHNPITMARMDRLFGVTMAERGVSQVVSVDLAAAEQFREAS
jgi:chromosome segregation protein